MSISSTRRTLPLVALVLALAATAFWAFRPASVAAPPPPRVAPAAAGTVTFTGLASGGTTTLPVVAFSTGGSNSGTTAGGGTGTGAGRFNAQDVSIALDTSTSDPLLLRALATGVRLQHVTVSLADGAQEWALDDVTISSGSWGRGDKAGSVQLTLAYTQIRLSSTDGRGGTVNTFCYNLATARAC